MAYLEFQKLSFRYPTDQRDALSGIEMEIRQGEFIVICGPSGSGKSTLLRHLKPELTPAGDRKGDVLFKGSSLYSSSGAEAGREIGMVLQEPDSQIVSDQVLTELVFGLESHGIPDSEMRQRIAEIVHFFGMEDWLHRSTHTLSGGQKQLLNLASVMALQPSVLLLDEPTAQLDPVASRQLLQWLQRLNEEFGMTIVMCEHRLDECIPLADRVLMMRNGHLMMSAAPRMFLQQLNEQQEEELQLYMPIPSRLYYACSTAEGGTADQGVPLTVKEGKGWFEQWDGKFAVDHSELQQTTAVAGAKSGKQQEVLRCSNVSFKYEKQDPWVLQQLNLTCTKDDFICVLGANGSGKSTLLQILAGFRRPVNGKVRLLEKDIYRMKDKELYRRIGYLAQNPLLHFVYDTIEEELEHAAIRSEQDPKHSVEEWLNFFGLQPLRKQHPYDLSGGERQKAALASIMISRPEILLLDEPTKGLDPVFKQQLGERLTEMSRQGVTIVMVTHDVEFASQYANRCLLLFAGEVTSQGTPADFFSRHYFYTTAVNRIVRSQLPNAITMEDVLRCRS
ncbi:ABC transporter ATP-binding protein [Marinicrinis lubricantis]|uniref:ABC transporter ATP-binding protein n=1 Tax=Marinicrinis lubricantis TaxID=2086470 RepID=A0ABW1ITE5_9BACL